LTCLAPGVTPVFLVAGSGRGFGQGGITAIEGKP
jgi:hypothetical protein